MSLPLTCWDYIIGLSRTECECYDAVTTLRSDSGLYLDELVELRSVNGLLNCEHGTEIWDMMSNSRDEAVRIFIGDVNALLMRSYQLKRQPYYGAIGRVKYSADMSLTTGYYYGARIFCANIVSGNLIIKKIGTLFNTTGTITLWVYNNKNELVATRTLNTTANTHNNNVLAVPIELPMHDGYVDNLEYYFIYKLAANIPKNNEVKCNCGKFKATFNTGKPYFFWSQAESRSQDYWSRYAMVGGFARSSITDLSDLPTVTSNYMHGLTFEVEFKCIINEVLCKDYFDFDANPLAISTALAIRYKAGQLLLEMILRTVNINRDVMINREQITADRDAILAKYNEHVNYIASNVNVQANDCLECRDLIKIAKAGIFTTYDPEH
ncbi:MAG: hypothetical protein NTZ85_01635 [Bacteroidia bacterium]|nr:hypothetical protein [Bacteroidia bacterium]